MIKQIDFEKSELAASVEELKRNKIHLIEHAKLVAEIKSEYYKALIEQGFDEYQALELCKESIYI